MTCIYLRSRYVRLTMVGRMDANIPMAVHDRRAWSSTRRVMTVSLVRVVVSREKPTHTRHIQD
jgi:hypothetical protein